MLWPLQCTDFNLRLWNTFLKFIIKVKITESDSFTKNLTRFLYIGGYVFTGRYKRQFISPQRSFTNPRWCCGRYSGKHNSITASSNAGKCSTSLQILYKNVCIVTNFYCAIELVVASHQFIANYKSGQYRFRQWLIAWRDQAITWTNVALSSMRSSGNYDFTGDTSAVNYWNSVENYSSKIHLNLTGAN